MRKVKLGLRLWRWQDEVDKAISAAVKYLVIVCARQRGKTTYLQYRLFRWLLKRRKRVTKILFGGPTIEHIQELYWNPVVDFANKVGTITTKQYASGNLSFTIKFKDHVSKIHCYFRGSQNSKRMVGQAYDLGILDEMGLWDKGVFFGSLFPAFEKSGGHMWVTGTVRGPDDYHELYSRFSDKMRGGDKRYYTCIWTIEDTYTPKKEIQELLALYKNRMDLYRREYLCDWFAGVKGHIYSDNIEQARKENRIGKLSYNKALPVYTLWDIGISAKTVIWFYQVDGSKYHFIDYVEGVEEVLDYYVDALKSRPYQYAIHYLPHDSKRRDQINLIPYFRHLEERLQTGYGRVKALPRVTSTDLAIDTTKGIFHTFWFDVEKCALGLRALSLWKRKWNAQVGAFSKNQKIVNFLMLLRLYNRLS